MYAAMFAGGVLCAAERAWKRRSAWAQRFSPVSESLSCGEVGAGVASGCVSAAGRLSRDGAESAV